MAEPNVLEANRLFMAVRAHTPVLSGRSADDLTDRCLVEPTNENPRPKRSRLRASDSDVRDRHVPERAPAIDTRNMFDESPDVRVEAAELILGPPETFVHFARAPDLGSVANDPQVPHQPFKAHRVDTRHACRIEIEERFAIGLALPEDRLPASTPPGRVQA
jgi:hypothetical protein